MLLARVINTMVTIQPSSAMVVIMATVIAYPFRGSIRLSLNAVAARGCGAGGEGATLNIIHLYSIVI